MTILVTGGAGYIGSHCVRLLREAGYDVVAVDNLVKGHKEAVCGAKLYTGNIGDEALMDKILDENKIDGVIHFAAYSLVGESMVKPYEYYKNNVCESLSLFGSLVRHGVKYIVFSSTAAVYGEPESVPILETMNTSPINTYGETKITIEKMLKWFDNAYGLKNTCLRYFNVAGAYPDGTIGEAHSPETHLIPIILQVANGKREKLDIFGDDYPTPDGTCIRDYIHVCDLIKAHILALGNMMKTNESAVYNLGSGGGYSNMQILEAAREVTGHPIPAAVKPRRAGDPPSLIASSEKAETVLGWTRDYDIRGIISTAWNWHKNHPDGYGE